MRRGQRGSTTTRQRPMPAREPVESSRHRSHGDPSGGHRRPQPKFNGRPIVQHSASVQSAEPSSLVKRRRMNVLFILVVTAASTMFLAATTQSSVMLWVFGLSFLALCGYVYILAQIREREDVSWGNGWLEQR